MRLGVLHVTTAFLFNSLIFALPAQAQTPPSGHAEFEALVEHLQQTWNSEDLEGLLSSWRGLE
jgi:hypothetical protein